MSPCPPVLVLQRLLAGDATDAEVQTLEAHLDICASCRRRLDELSNVTEVGSALLEATPGPLTMSAGLQRVLHSLATELPARRGADTGVEATILRPTDRPGFIGRLGGIEIERVIGRGGMGVVYKGLDPKLNRTVAVKVLSPHLLGDELARERFLREARAAAQLADEHIVTIHSIDEVDGAPFLVLQHVAGESLAELLGREQRLPIARLATIGAHIARGLAAAHARGLVHRDVKPANVLIEESSGVVRLTDFGLAKLIGGESITGIGIVAGTPAYMSPEQAAGKEMDSRSDLFSLGTLLYSAAAGKLPFGGDSPFVVLSQIQTATPQPLAEIDPTIPPWFCGIVERLLHKEPDGRLQTAREVAELLDNRGKPAQAKSGPRRWWMPAAAALLVVVAGVVYFQRSSATNPNVPINPVAPGPVAVGQSGFFVRGQDAMHKTLGDAVATAADGATIEVHGPGPHLENRVEIRGKRLTIVAADGVRPRIQPAAPGELGEAQWLNSDRELTLDGLDVIWPVTGGKPPLDPSNMRATLGGRCGKLTVRNCRIVASRQASCIAPMASDVTIEHSQLIAEGGIGIWWLSSPGGKLHLRSTIVEAETALFISFSPVEPVGAAAEADITNCTVAARGFIGFVFQMPPRYRVRAHAQRNLIDSSFVFGVPTRLANAQGATTRLRSLLDWSERENVYDRRGNFLAAVRVAPFTIYPANLATLPDWLDFWQARDIGSIEGDIRFRTRTPSIPPSPLHLERVDDATDRVPSPIGAHDLQFK